MNDCKYGYDVRGNVLRLSLLRSPTWPDPVADRGPNRFTYALLPHRGDFRAGRVIEEARELNLPLRVVPAAAHAGHRPARASIVRVDQPGIEIVAVKPADRTDGVVVRLCELWGRRTPVRLTMVDAITAAARTDLLERDLEPLAVDRNGTLALELLPFELATLRLELDPDSGFGVARARESGNRDAET